MRRLSCYISVTVNSLSASIDVSPTVFTFVYREFASTRIMADKKCEDIKLMDRGLCAYYEKFNRHQDWFNDEKYAVCLFLPYINVCHC